jgi:hypothetical protein
MPEETSEIEKHVPQFPSSLAISMGCIQERRVNGLETVPFRGRNIVVGGALKIEPVEKQVS